MKLMKVLLSLLLSWHLSRPLDWRRKAYSSTAGEGSADSNRQGFVSKDSTKEVVGIVERSIPSLGPGGVDKKVTITAIRHIYNKTVLFRAIDKVSFKVSGENEPCYSIL